MQRQMSELEGGYSGKKISIGAEPATPSSHPQILRMASVSSEVETAEVDHHEGDQVAHALPTINPIF